MPKTYLLFILLLSGLWTTGGFAQAPVIDLQFYASGFNDPVDIVNAGDDRLFIVEQDGIIRIIDASGSVLNTPFMNIDARVNSSASERGLLGLTFHPDYANNGYFYVNYTNNAGDTRISRFSVTADANVADPNSELILMTIDQPFSNHNAGDLNFGPDGYLYFGLGDGGSFDDPGNRSQNPQELLGKMIRIDVDGGSPYAIPPDNPFVNDNSTLDEIWALGIRNPWRFSFDRLTGDMWIGDVGQDAWEEIHFEPANSGGGFNYGWRCYEGNAPYITGGCGPSTNYTFPVAVYSHAGAPCRSVTGGFVYRGQEFPNLYGVYLYVDYCTGEFWGIVPDGNGGWINYALMNESNFQYVTFGEDNDGEMYVAATGSGIIYKIIELCSTVEIIPSITAESCDGDEDGSINLLVSGGSTPYNFSWSNGGNSQTISNLAAGMYTVTVGDNEGCSFVETYEITNSSPVAPQITPDGSTTVCTGAVVVLNSSIPPLGSNIQWLLDGMPIQGETGLSLLLDQIGTGNYSAIFVGTGCSSVPSPEITVEISDFPSVPTITQVDNELMSSPAFSYQWYLDGNLIEGATDQFYTAEVTGEYVVIVANEAGCTSLSMPLNVVVTSIQNPLEIDQVQILPNPFKDAFDVQLTLNQPSSVTLILRTSTGQILETEQLNAGTQLSYRYNGKNWAPGIYLLEIRTDSGSMVRKVMNVK